MTTQTQPPPRPDWSKANLSPEHMQDLHRLFDIKTKYKIAAATGMAFLGFIRHHDLNEHDKEYLLLAWNNLILFDAY